MSLYNYGVLKGIPVRALPGSDKSPHYQILVHGENGNPYRIAVNIKSQGYPSDVLYYVDEQVDTEKTEELMNLPYGFTPIRDNKPPIGIDFIRGNWFDPAKMTALPPDVDGPNNDLNDQINHYLNEAFQREAIIYAFGAKWGPEKKADGYFGFVPGQGIHDIHMNQGNEGRWERDNGTYQDGGLLLQFKDKWVSIFLAFQSQSWCTDDLGNPLKPVEECNHVDAGSKVAKR
ncbi:DUF2278 family protein [Falsibacillus pallidus]|uniref:DUF2278 family protein n=1 Tax=Falsibacillus pallidus TaxID=493781 RepID=UPI003D993977